MLKLFFIIFIIFIIAFFVKKKVKIKFKSFFKKGFKKDKNIFGVYCYCGKQGSSKTLNVVNYLYENRDKVIYANLKSLNSDEIPYKYINGLDELLELRKEHDCIIFFDEIFTEINKHQRISKDVMDFLSQMRKRRIVFITTCQEWRLLPLDFRLYVRYQINCSMFSLPFFNACSIKNIIDGDNIKWSDEEQDFVGELVENTIWHCEKFIANCYDTYEQIGKFSSFSSSCASESKQEEEKIEHFAHTTTKGQNVVIGQDTTFWENDTILKEDISDEE